MSQFLLSATVVAGNKTEICSVFLDSGAGVNLVDSRFAQALGFTPEPVRRTIPVFAIDCSPLTQRELTQIVHNIHLQVGDLHKEHISCYVLDGLPAPMVLGLPWLVTHNPVVDWQAGEIVEWSEHCKDNCLSSRCSTLSVTSLPSFLSDFMDVFSEKGCQGLPPHRP